MKKILMGLMGLVCMTGFWSCDKIEEGEYTVYDGAVVIWTPDDTYIAPVQRVLVEKFTGPRCSNCPLADATLSGIHDERVVMVSINHPTGQGIPYPNQPDMRTDGGTVWDNWFGINAIPAAYVNRDKSKQYLGDMSNIVADINQALTTEPVVALIAAANREGNEVQVETYLDFVKKYTDPVTLTVALVEDSLVYRQLLPDNSFDDEYVHNHMLRKVVTSYWGATVTATGDAGEGVKGKLSFTLGSDIVPENCHIVAFVSDKATKRVLNCAACKIGE